MFVLKEYHTFTDSQHSSPVMPQSFYNTNFLIALQTNTLSANDLVYYYILNVSHEIHVFKQSYTSSSSRTVFVCLLSESSSS